MYNFSHPAPTHITAHRAFTVLCTTSLLLLTSLLSPATMAAALISPPCHVRHQQYHTSFERHRSTAQYNSPTDSPLEDEPWKEDDSYWDALQIASKDPEKFEKFIEESMERKKKGVKYSATMQSSSAGVNGDATAENAPKKGKYVPIEEWDEQRENGENMSSEERLQWECQRNGNQFNQNEILTRNLNSF
mmetsp:Transcript_32880/g.69183  ORF Transcript_32880/g.69183 Transcript_32880/m.69183 type:complete len:190 (-) Transcript_32880:100-669(-)